MPLFLRFEDLSMSDLIELKAQADELGIKYSPNISAATLQQRINDALAGKEDSSDTSGEITPIPVLSQAEKIKQIRKEALRLVRVIITPMDSTKRDYHGEIFQFSNRILSAKRFVPFGHTTHVEAVLLEQIKQRQMRQTIPETRDKAPESRLMPAFAVQELPPLTAQDLAELAQAQQARNSIE